MLYGPYAPSEHTKRKSSTVLKYDTSCSDEFVMASSILPPRRDIALAALLVLSHAPLCAAQVTPCRPGAIDLTFNAACALGSPATNNLGGEGPGNGPMEMRFSGVGKYNGATFDLVVTTLTSYFTAVNTINGCSSGGLFGRIKVWVRPAPSPNLFCVPSDVG